MHNEGNNLFCLYHKQHMLYFKVPLRKKNKFNYFIKAKNRIAAQESVNLWNKFMIMLIWTKVNLLCQLKKLYTTYIHTLTLTQQGFFCIGLHMKNFKNLSSYSPNMVKMRCEMTWGSEGKIRHRFWNCSGWNCYWYWKKTNKSIN